jgi:hypothetical protein
LWALSLGLGLGLFGVLALCYSFTYFSGRGMPPWWVGPLSGIGEISLILVAPICLLVSFVTFILSSIGGNGPNTEKRPEPSAAADRPPDDRFRVP